MEEQWLNNLKERSKSFERKASDGLWDGVMQSLEAKGVVKAKTKLSTIWLRWAVAAAAVLLPAVIGYVALNLGDVSMRQPVTSVEKVAALPLVVANDTALKSGVAAVQTNNLPVLAARKAAVKSQGDDEMAAVLYIDIAHARDILSLQICPHPCSSSADGINETDLRYI